MIFVFQVLNIPNAFSMQKNDQSDVLSQLRIKEAEAIRAHQEATSRYVELQAECEDINNPQLLAAKEEYFRTQRQRESAQTERVNAEARLNLKPTESNMPSFTKPSFTFESPTQNQQYLSKFEKQLTDLDDIKPGVGQTTQSESFQVDQYEQVMNVWLTTVMPLFDSKSSLSPDELQKLTALTEKLKKKTKEVLSKMKLDEVKSRIEKRNTMNKEICVPLKGAIHGNKTDLVIELMNIFDLYKQYLYKDALPDELNEVWKRGIEYLEKQSPKVDFSATSLRTQVATISNGSGRSTVGDSEGFDGGEGLSFTQKGMLGLTLAAVAVATYYKFKQSIKKKYDEWIAQMLPQKEGGEQDQESATKSAALEEQKLESPVVKPVESVP